MAPPRKFDRTMAIKMFADGSAKRAIARSLEVDMGSILHALRQESISSQQDAERWLSLHGMTPPARVLASPVSLDRPIADVIASRLADSDRVEARLAGGNGTRC